MLVLRNNINFKKQKAEPQIDCHKNKKAVDHMDRARIIAENGSPDFHGS